MKEGLLALAKGLANIVCPVRCASCGNSLPSNSSDPVCAPCRARIKKSPGPQAKKAMSACLYEGPLRELVHAFKYGNKRSLAPFLSSLMTDFMKENPELLFGVNSVTFVPLHDRRLRERGFNQSRLLASGLAAGAGIPLADLLEKTKVTCHQNELSRDRRLVNLKGAFKAKRGTGIKGSIILLIDDVMTTGETLNECAKTLLEAGAKEVRSLTLARGV